MKFQISETLSHASAAADCQLAPVVVSNNIPHYTNIIRVRKSFLEDGSNSNILIAQTIIHELLHAYLNIKLKNCNAGASIPYINNLELGQLIQVFYQNFNCHPNVNGASQSQHQFMFDHLVPIFTTIFSEIRNDLIPQSQISYVEQALFVDSTLGINELWNWDKFYKYLALSGLHQCDSYQTNVENIPKENYLMNVYNANINLFSRSCN